MSKSGVLVVGSANMDLVVTTERFPKPGETIFGKSFQMFPGGKGANQAVSSAKLGVKTIFIGKFGNDDFCKRLTESMADNGVQLQHILIDENETTGTALITVEKHGQNEIIVISGSNMKLTPDDIEKSKQVFKEVNVVLAQLEIPIETVIKTAQLSKANGAVFILNPAPAQQLPDELLQLCDYLIPNETELEILSGIKVTDESSARQAAEKLAAKGVSNIIVTMGEKGALFVNGKAQFYPAIKVEAVDTTAAGDAFCGALAYSLAKEISIDKAITLANKVASISVTRSGAQSSMPYCDEVKDLIESL